jgi:diguanylate cyclase (GGDEF)-like protein
MAYHKHQKLNSWVDMLHSIYGLSQNYAKTEYEILAHLSEVTGAFSKYLFKLKQPEKAKEFLPKMFGWASALLKKVKGDRANFEEILLLKYPCVCPYCTSAPCECVPGRKQPIDEEKVRHAYVQRTPSQGRSLNEFQMMFRRIYESSWGLRDVPPGSAHALEKLQKMFTRLIEEISELGEAVRFAHLYPSNFDNELADYIAWLFAFVSSLDKAGPETQEMFTVQDVFWPAYPGICIVCMLDVCDCRPSPVRELLSKPSMKDLRYTDSLTQSANRAQFDLHLEDVSSRALPLPVPISCIRVDIDDFRVFNAPPFDHTLGDEALKHVVNLIRQKIRTRDRLYRVGGDEFAVLCPDLSSMETQGMMSRIASALKDKPVPMERSGVSAPRVTLSVGIAECRDTSQIRQVFTDADTAAIESKNSGKDRITVFVTTPVAKNEVPE